jgi:hypothetical protein
MNRRSFLRGMAIGVAGLLVPTKYFFLSGNPLANDVIHATIGQYIDYVNLEDLSRIYYDKQTMENLYKTIFYDSVPVLRQGPQ